MDINEFKSLIEADRTIRRYRQTPAVTHEQAISLVELTRYCASGRNLQPLRYRAVTEARELKNVFPHLAWAGYYTDWAGPEEGERPTAYLVQTIDTRLAQDAQCDAGIQMQAITLGARAMGLGACIIKSFSAAKVAEALGLPNWAKPLHVIALGAPGEDAGIEDMKDGDVKYHRDADGRQIVPKRTLDELIIK